MSSLSRTPSWRGPLGHLRRFAGTAGCGISAAKNPTVSRGLDDDETLQGLSCDRRSVASAKAFGGRAAACGRLAGAVLLPPTFEQNRKE